jgi:hypothetical protein
VTLRRAAVLALAVAGCLALSGCVLLERAADQVESTVDLLLLAFFGVSMSLCALVGAVVALTRGLRRSRRSLASYLNVAIATPFAVAAVLLQMSVAGTVGRTHDTLRLMLLSSSPLFWLAAALIELGLAPALPPGPTGAPPRLTAARVAAAVVPVVVALTLYGLLLDHAVKLYRGQPFW